MAVILRFERKTGLGPAASLRNAYASTLPPGGCGRRPLGGGLRSRGRTVLHSNKNDRHKDDHFV